jgi:hypothetical protein
MTLGNHRKLSDKYLNDIEFSLLVQTSDDPYSLQIVTKVPSSKKKVCIVKVKDYLARFAFFHGWSNLDQIKIINEIIGEDNVLAIKKRSIRAEFLPSGVSLDLFNKFLVVDLMTSGSQCHLITFFESNAPVEEKTRTPFKIEKKIGFIQKDPQTFFFRTGDFLSSSIQLQFIASVLSTVLNDLLNKTLTDSIVQYYQSRTKLSKPEKKQKKTGQRSDILKELEQNIFDTGFTQLCQKGKQPYVVETEEEFIETAEKAFKNDAKYWEPIFGNIPLEQRTIKKLIEIKNIEKTKKQQITFNDFLFRFPTEEHLRGEYEGLQFKKERIYACLPRIQGEDPTYMFPGIRGSHKAPCCFVNPPKPASKATGIGIHKFGFDKILPAEREGYVSPFINLLDSKDIARFGVNYPTFMNCLDVAIISYTHTSQTFEKLLQQNSGQISPASAKQLLHLVLESKRQREINQCLTTRQVPKKNKLGLEPGQLTTSAVNYLTNLKKKYDDSQWENLAFDIGLILAKNVIILDRIEEYNTIITYPRLFPFYMFTDYIVLIKSINMEVPVYEILRHPNMIFTKDDEIVKFVLYCSSKAVESSRTFL